MALSYSAALERLQEVAQSLRACRTRQQESVPLEDAVGRIASCDLASPKSTPEHDTSAMDGYAIRSQATTAASLENPAVFRIHGTVAAGDDPRHLVAVPDGDGVEPCVEIMTGGIFPDGAPEFDACVKVEDTLLATARGRGCERYVLVTKPVNPNANRRFAGNDIGKGDVIVRRGESIRLSHLMPLASVGFESAPVLRKLRVGVFSTGKELVRGKGGAADVNGPYLTAALRGMAVDADFLGTLDDDPATLQYHLQREADSALYDVILTSGAVSVGKFDFVRQVLDRMSAEIVFHGLAIRPGHPVLFALVPSADRKTAFFGLPGNPGAAAACFRFLVVPYLRSTQGQGLEQAEMARLRRSPDHNRHKNMGPGHELDSFRHGVLEAINGELVVEATEQQSPAKLWPFIRANSWIHVERDRELEEAGLVKCYPISPGNVAAAL